VHLAPTNSLAMITDYVPGAYITHDQLHIRGGHQVSWLVDGVPVPNTNIASNVGPQFDPKDVDYLEADRGSYGAELGDRTYGIFNISPRTGFERNNEGELITSFGNFYQTNDQINFGSHTQRFAYYASLNGNRSNLGLQPAVPQIIHDAENGYGGFGSLIYNPNASDQLRLITSLRKDYYQVPYDPDPNSFENSQYDSSGLRDGQHEGDVILNFSWVHTFNSKLLLTVSPFYHYNSANYDANPNDFPVATTDHRSSNYVGGQATFTATLPRNNLQAGLYSFYQSENQLFAAIFNDRSNPNFAVRTPASGSLAAFFLDDKKLLGGVDGPPDEKRRVAFLEANQRARQMAAARLKSNSKDGIGLLTLTLTDGMEADYDALIEKRQFVSLHMIRAAENDASLLLSVEPNAQDAYVAVGAANYIIGCLPGYKRAFLWLGGIHGDRRRGMSQLQLAADHGQYLQPFAKALLALAALREKQPQLARTLFEDLHHEFPTNPVFARELAQLQK
jgi:hypothetical protein